VGFVALVRGGSIGATFPFSDVGFVALAGRGAIRATKPMWVHFVALTLSAPIRATLGAL
jgi:hypothetical protein